MDGSNTSVMSHSADEVDSRPDLIAIGLLKLQQRLDALDRLYNEEVSTLSRELTELKADYVRLYQARVTSSTAKSARGQAPRSQTHRTHRMS